MTPFEQFQLWLRRAPAGERVLSSAVGIVVLSLLVLIVLPVTGNGGGGGQDEVVAGAPSATDGGQPGSTTPTTGGATRPTTAAPSAATASDPTAATVAPIGSTGASSQPVGASDSAGCSPGNDQGISSSEIRIAITVLEAAGPTTNAAFGVPSADEQRQAYELVIDDLNKRGGVACRKLVAKYYTVNGLDEGNMKATCLDIVASKVFAVIDAGAYYGVAAANCFPQNKLPFFGTGSLAPEQRDQFYPYMFGNGAIDTIFRNGVLAFDRAGFFTKGPTFKLGWAYRDCWRSHVNQVRDLLHRVGLADSQIVQYSLGCPTGYASPADIQQAILKFQSERVTHVIESDMVFDFASFTNVAQSQGFKPKYALLDQELVPTTQGNFHVNYDNVEGALIVNSIRYGDEAAGIDPNGATRRCDALSVAAGKPPTYRQLIGFGGVACNQVWMLAAAIEATPALQRSALAEGLQAAKSIETAYPGGPVDWSGAKTTYGGQFWRVQTFRKACTCWKVGDPAFHPSFR